MATDDQIEAKRHDGTYETAREICKWFGPEAGYEFDALTDTWCVVIEVEADGEVHYDRYGTHSEIAKPIGKSFALSDVRREDLNRLTMRQAVALADTPAA